LSVRRRRRAHGLLNSQTEMRDDTHNHVVAPSLGESH
jgi:hypothetical protein